MFTGELAPLASHIFSRVKSFALAEILVARGFRLALRGGKGLAKRLMLYCCHAESGLPVLFLLFGRIKKEPCAYNCALRYIPCCIVTRIQSERGIRRGRTVVIAFAAASVTVGATLHENVFMLAVMMIIV
jgi:hypothetical protein